MHKTESNKTEEQQSYIVTGTIAEYDFNQEPVRVARIVTLKSISEMFNLVARNAKVIVHIDALTQFEHSYPFKVTHGLMHVFPPSLFSSLLLENHLSLLRSPSIIVSLQRGHPCRKYSILKMTNTSCIYIQTGLLIPPTSLITNLHQTDPNKLRGLIKFEYWRQPL